MGVTGNKVILEAKDENKPGQLWIKGEQIYRDHFAYFTLRNFESSAKFLTPVGSLSTSSFGIKGNKKEMSFNVQLFTFTC